MREYHCLCRRTKKAAIGFNLEKNFRRPHWIIRTLQALLSGLAWHGNSFLSRPPIRRTQETEIRKELVRFGDRRLKIPCGERGGTFSPNAVNIPDMAIHYVPDALGGTHSFGNPADRPQELRITTIMFVKVVDIGSWLKTAPPTLEIVDYWRQEFQGSRFDTFC